MFIYIYLFIYVYIYIHTHPPRLSSFIVLGVCSGRRLQCLGSRFRVLCEGFRCGVWGLGFKRLKPEALNLNLKPYTLNQPQDGNQ